MDGRERQGLGGTARVGAALRRAGYLVGIAFLFRVQLWLFGWPASPWTDLFKVDILNCMGFTVALMSVMALFRTTERVRLCAILGFGITAASPLVTQLDWFGVPALLKHYIAPDYAHFSFFPWAAFLAFGVSAGSLLRVVPRENIERLMQWSALAGAALLLACQYFSNLPYTLYPKSEFWLDSPAQILSKLGVILMILPFAFLWTRYGATETWSWVRQFGTTSLLVYWVHIELVYGRWLCFWKESLNVGQTALAALGVILLMLAISVIKSNRHKWDSLVAALRWIPPSEPRRVPGD
jgi:hypothetical protein